MESDNWKKSSEESLRKVLVYAENIGSTVRELEKKCSVQDRELYWTMVRMENGNCFDRTDREKMMALRLELEKIAGLFAVISHRVQKVHIESMKILDMLKEVKTEDEEAVKSVYLYLEQLGKSVAELKREYEKCEVQQQVFRQQLEQMQICIRKKFPVKRVTVREALQRMHAFLKMRKNRR